MIKIPNRNMVSDLFAHHLKCPRSEENRGCLYVMDEYLGLVTKMEHVGVGLLYNNFNGRTCAMHIIVQHKRALTRKVVREAFEYPFIDCGLNAVITAVDSKNTESLDLARRVGFKEVHRVVDGGVEGDMVLLQMRHDECRWIKGKNHG